MSRKILLLTTPFRPNVGGVETHLDDLISEGVKLGYHFLVLTYQPLITNARGKAIERGKGFTIYRVPWLRMNLFLLLETYPILEFLYLFPGLFFFSLILIFFKRLNFDVIHAQGLVAGAMGVFLGKILAKPVIISTHSIYNFPQSGLYPWFIRFIFNNCEHVLTLSRQSKKEVIDLGIPKERVSHFTYWVDQKVFKPMKKRRMRKILKLSEDNFYCLFVGRLVAVKGIKEILEAAEITNREVTFIIIGDGPMARDVRISARKNKNICFVGKVKNEDLPLFYNAADVLIVPSVHEEGFGRVILEALSCGLPVIASNRGGIRESLSIKVGILINVTAQNIKTVLEDLFAERKKLKSLALKTKIYAKIHFGSKNIKMITKHYE